jgi:hypothetical protein
MVLKFKSNTIIDMVYFFVFEYFFNSLLMHLLKCYLSFTTVGSYISIEIYNNINSDINKFEFLMTNCVLFDCFINFKLKLKKKLNKF